MGDANNIISVSGIEEFSSVNRTEIFPVTRQVYRLLIMLTMVAFLAMWTTGYLRDLIFFAMPFLFLKLVLGRGLVNKPKLIQFCSVIVLFYSLNNFRSELPGVVILMEFTIMILFLQLQTVNTARSACGVLILTLMIILAVAAMNINFLFPLCLVPYLLLFYYLLNKITMLRHNELAKQKLQIDGRSFFSFRSFARCTVAIVSFCFLWFFMFYLVPRQPSYGLASEISKRRLKGFNESLSLGEGGLLEDNPAVVMRIKPTDEKSFTPSVVRRLRRKLIRGTSFTSYFNGSWQRVRRRRFFIDLRKNSGSLELIKNVPKDKSLHQLEISLENTEPPLIFIPDLSISAEFDVSYIGMERDRSLYFLNKTSSRHRYLVRVMINPLQVKDASVKNLKLTGPFRAYMTRVGIDKNVLRLAENLASGSITINQSVQSVMNYLKNNCTYSLYENFTGPEDPVSHFLFNSRAGSCEHFASAMTLMLRALRIPARPVNGYTMGDWNELGGFFTVRQRHAHSWVEVYFPESGWVPFDPSPVADLYEPESEIERFLVQLWELYEGSWFTYVYNFDHQVQMAGFKKIVDEFEMMLGNIYNFVYRLRFLLPLLLIYYYIFSRYRMQRRFFYSSWLPDWYLDWCFKLEVKRNEWETPQEFHKRLIQSGVFPEDTRKVLIELANLINLSLSKYADRKEIDTQAKKLLSELKREHKI